MCEHGGSCLQVFAVFCHHRLSITISLKLVTFPSENRRVFNSKFRLHLLKKVMIFFVSDKTSWNTNWDFQSVVFLFGHTGLIWLINWSETNITTAVLMWLQVLLVFKQEFESQCLLLEVIFWILSNVHLHADILHCSGDLRLSRIKTVDFSRCFHIKVFLFWDSDSSDAVGSCEENREKRFGPYGYSLYGSS